MPKKIKCLEVPAYIHYMRKYREEEAALVTPVFNRDGVYCTQDACWYEYQGTAREYNRKDFLYELKMLDAEETYNVRLFKTIEELLFVHKVKDKRLQSMYYAWRDMLAIRATYRNTRKVLRR